MKVLNAFCGIGGNRKHWDEIPGLEITAVDISPGCCEEYQKNFPSDTVVTADAWEYIRQNHYNYTAIWASPPCPTHSRMRPVNYAKKDKAAFVYPDMQLYGLIIALNNFYRGKFIVENVIGYYDPLIEPTLTINHHYLWSNIRLKIERYRKPRFDDYFRTHKMTYTDYKRQFESHYGITLSKKILLPDTNGKLRDDTVLRNIFDPELGLILLKSLLKSSARLTDYFAMPSNATMEALS